MSEVIVRMEMPTGCPHCPMADDDSRFCKAAKKYIPMLGKPLWCPIKGVLPDGHGDLIDRDALMIELIDRGIEGVQTDDLAEFQQIVMDAKAVIAAERKDDEQIH